MNDDLLKVFLLQYMQNKITQLDNDLIAVKNRVSIYNLNAKDYHELILCETRLDTAASIFRQISDILKYYH